MWKNVFYSEDGNMFEKIKSIETFNQFQCFLGNLIKSIALFVRSFNALFDSFYMFSRINIINIFF